MNGVLMLDAYMHEISKKLEPASGVLDISKPFSISGIMKFPKPVMSTINAWLTTTRVENKLDEHGETINKSAPSLFDRLRDKYNKEGRL